jgi:hypothetical protein
MSLLCKERQKRNLPSGGKTEGQRTTGPRTAGRGHKTTMAAGAAWQGSAARLWSLFAGAAVPGIHITDPSFAVCVAAWAAAPRQGEGHHVPLLLGECSSLAEGGAASGWGINV